MAWANSKVDGSKIRSFGDPSLSTGVFLLKVRREEPAARCPVLMVLVVAWVEVR